MQTDIGTFLDRSAEQDLLRFTTAGSVDDGKSTLIGRLLHDAKAVYEDQLASVKDASGKINNEVEIDFALLTDGLKAEREQGITIDVAYRYFSTPKRKFIIADTPGHEQYTRNMATGASTANLAIILIDARLGVLTQSKRHSFIASLLGIPHFLIAVNKMDLVNYDEAVFRRIRADYEDFAAKLGVKDLHFIPISALHGDNVVEPSGRMPWYKGVPLLEYLESVYIASDRNLIDLRFPVQYVLRPHLDFRGYAGQIASGVLKKGDEVMVLPSLKSSRIRSIVSYDGELEYAFTPQSVTVTLEDELDISRGDMLVHPNNMPKNEKHFEAMLVWMSEKPLDPAGSYLIKHTTRMTKVRIDELRYRIDVNTLHKQNAAQLDLNEIGRVVFTAGQDLFFDAYAKNRSTGSFIIIDYLSNNTVAAGMIIERTAADRLPSRITGAERRQAAARHSLVAPEERSKRYRQKPVTIWLTGLHASGKNEVAYALERKLFDLGATGIVLDGSVVRSGVSRELDFSAADRAEHLRRVAEIAKIINDAGQIAICAFISPQRQIRRQLAAIIGPHFIEVYAQAGAPWCESRDHLGLYAKARDGHLRNFPGIDAPYEAPDQPAITLAMEKISAAAAADQILEYLRQTKYFPLP
jgi:adenylyl-sulfate kinase